MLASRYRTFGGRPPSFIVSPHVKRLMVVLVVCGTFSQLIGCDCMWIQKSSVKVHPTDFSACASHALTDVPGVSIDEAHSTSENLVLNTPLRPEGKGPVAYIVLPDASADTVTSEVRFGAWGLREPRRERERITPLLNAITDTIGSHCGAG